MRELQQAIHEWQMKTFKCSDSLSKYNHLIKEIKELGDEIIGGNPYKLKLEIADCCFLLFGIASLNNIDIEDAIRTKFEINKTRNWGEPDSNGVVEHIKEGTE